MRLGEDDQRLFGAESDTYVAEAVVWTVMQFESNIGPPYLFSYLENKGNGDVRHLQLSKSCDNMWSFFLDKTRLWTNGLVEQS